MKETKSEFKKRVLKITKEMFEYMELGNYRVNVKFRDDMEDWQVMTIVPCYEYLEAHLKVNINIIKDGFSDDHIRWLICHELCHIHTHHICSLAEKSISKNNEESLRVVHESMTERFARLILKGMGVKISGVKAEFK